MFSRSCQYALQATLFIHLHSFEGKAVKIKDISDSQNIPIHFLGKILQMLVKHKILISEKGPNGGFILAKNGRDLTLLEVVKVVDGLDIFDHCGIGLKECSDDQPCPIHNEFKVIKERIKILLSQKTLDELCIDIKEGNSIVNYVE